MATQSEIASNIVTQLRLLDPSVSATIGTPERKIIDAVAQAIAGYQVDINMLNGAMDINAKFGADLDNMLALFGFGRQKGSKASGYVTFSTDVAKAAPIVITAGTQLLAPGASSGSDVVFITSRTVTLSPGSLSVVAPVECIASGEFGNIAANTITAWNQTAITGIISLTNASPIVGGTDSESDEALKTRFTATGPFRNLAGTQDQYLATALSTFTTKATVIGPISKYKEYIQVPSSNDSSNGNSSESNYTTALSTNLNAKYLYTNLPFYVSDDSSGVTIPYTQDVDFIVNITSSTKNKGDAYRLYQSDPINNPDPTNVANQTRPNVTFNNVYTGNDNTINLIKPQEILLFEYSYISSASRNDYERGVLNCVDIFVNGSDPQLSTAVIARPGSSVSIRSFTNVDLNSALYYDKFRRVGEPNHRPVVGNIFTPLLNQPVIDLPESISLSESTFIKGIHYWAVEDYTNNRGTIRARNGIEWSSTLRGKLASDNSNGPYNGPLITDVGAIQTTLTLDTSSTSSVAFVDSSSSFLAAGELQIDNEKIQYTKSSNTIWNSSSLYGYGTIDQSGGITATLGNSADEAFTISNDAGFNATGGYFIINNEIIEYSAFSGTTMTIKSGGRGKFGTTAAAHANNAVVSAYTTYNGAAYKTLQKVSSGSTNPSDTTVSGYWIKIGDILNLTRATSGTISVKHNLGTSVQTAFNEGDYVLNIENYIYDANIATLQAALEGTKQITTDVLAHKAKVRYFKPDITVMYNSGSTSTTVNSAIKTNLDAYFNSLYFGATIQLSDILQVIHNTTGVDNVKWSKDALGSATSDSSGNPRNRMTEVDINGNPIGIIMDLMYIGDSVTPTKYQMYFADYYSGGSFSMAYGSNPAESVAYSTNSATLKTSIQTALNRYGSVVTMTGNGSASDPFIITYTNKSDKNKIVFYNTELLVPSVSTKSAMNSDFMLKDDELPSLPVGLSVNGVLDLTSVMTVRVKAQNTWNQINA